MLKNKPLIVSLILIIFLISYLIISSNIKDLTKNNQILKSRLEELEIENQTIKEHYETEYFLRDTLDIKARSIYKSLIEKDLTMLEREVSNNTKVLPDTIIFTTENGEVSYDLYTRKDTPILRQRYYILSEDNRTFTTGYEIHSEYYDSIPVIIMIFSYENEDWKLSSILTE
ncbi:hypothetical protein [Alkaliphilus oremlandii]|uniref:Uncharacterized protein n=1 Tax=Alkaliphilus oremlandii (strain OhILAs) TaxID=350688 RepID=A8MFT1_ALKOO|nr:hypothetical protein [Alkaliphilus oremlandii]ABW17720.1 hypothetical protein Clos_0154 [Alkaliphilus oremlandii OhILAs]